MSYEDPANKRKKYTLYDGIVLYRDVFDVKDWPHNPCKSLHVKWTADEDEEDLSPWDVVPVGSNNNKKKMKQQAMNVLDPRVCRLVVSKWTLWIEENEHKAIDFISSPMDVPGYLNMVALPIWIDLLKTRLVKGYYR